MLISKVLAVVLSAAAAVIGTTYPDPGACSGDCTAIDPAVIRRSSDGVYFRFITFDEIRIDKANALTGPWVYQGAAIPGGSIIDLDGNTSLWAPDRHWLRDLADGGIRLLTDHGSTGIMSKTGDAYNAIDPTLLLDPVSGNYYMSFGSYWNGIYVVRMNSATTQVASGATYTNIAQQPNGNHAFEGSNIRSRDGYYYLSYSAGRGGNYVSDPPASGAEYKVEVCRSSSITGPYAGSAGNLCLNGAGGVILASHDNVYGPGGQGFFDDLTYGTVIYYHYADTDISLEKDDYQFGWNQIGWSSDGWPFLPA